MMFFDKRAEKKCEHDFFSALSKRRLQTLSQLSLRYEGRIKNRALDNEH